ncbi:DUF4846 domain-containing protein [Chitinophaga pendula]|uniref:DUF4846 domain-containing protein n=1 Tax=Chitinophaga TaxID=79328 RepID=UPI000BB0ADB6|nr:MULTISPECIES: DUF4846 domain-containing protein [Chitinophaga]ASZ11760.1 hypothetical protein CK934_12720 [Chitinophaga sp. MD30]UCJ05221.1 DUF4846 domain-containing protein [Chitinophaga pendula]
MTTTAFILGSLMATLLSCRQPATSNNTSPAISASTTAATSHPPANVAAIPAPPGYQRPQGNEFTGWLRKLPLKTNNTVYLFNGHPKRNQTAQFAVLDISVGNKDLQQCADAVIRLRAEFLYQQGAIDRIAFHATDGTLLDYKSWTKGYRFKLHNNRLSKVMMATPADNRASFLNYLETVFSFAGTQSLARDLSRITGLQHIQPGDVFIKGGTPGHAVIVMDVATDKNGHKAFLLAQSYMPAQDIHILRNPNDPALSPWYTAPNSEILYTPEWTFYSNQLARF